MNTVIELNKSLLLPSPLEYLPQISEKSGLKVYLKREDKIHSVISGNKWRKLKYNLIEAKKTGKSKIISFGGPFSNHIHALSAACKALNFELYLFIRGYSIDPDNPTLQFVQAQGAKIQLLSKTDYRLKERAEAVVQLTSISDQYYLIPEGGSNMLALNGVAEMYQEIRDQLGFIPNYIVVTAGTGATAAGLIKASLGDGEIVVVNVLKNPGLHDEIKNYLDGARNYSIQQDFHRGGYAKSDPGLVAFINSFKENHGVLLDPVYTGKMMMAFENLLLNNFFKAGSSVILIHSGGLQGIAGHNYIHHSKKEMQITL